jgi:hypothetical protein
MLAKLEQFQFRIVSNLLTGCSRQAESGFRAGASLKSKRRTPPIAAGAFKPRGGIDWKLRVKRSNRFDKIRNLDYMFSLTEIGLVDGSHRAARGRAV